MWSMINDTEGNTHIEYFLVVILAMVVCIGIVNGIYCLSESSIKSIIDSIA